MNLFIPLFSLASVICFILGIKLLSRVKTAQKGNFIASIGMLFAVIATLLYVETISLELAFAGILLGSVIGIFLAKKVEMTAMPELVAIFNGLGGASSLLVAMSIYYGTDFKSLDEGYLFITSLLLGLSIGAITFSGSIVAFLKLSGNFPGKIEKLCAPLWIKGILLLLLLVSGFMLISGGHLSHSSEIEGNILGLLFLSLVLGVVLVASIGGADMPVVISLLNSYSGLAAVATGFVLGNVVLIVSGSLVGASGIFLTQIMCKAMNRSLANVFFGGMGTSTPLGNQNGEKATEYTSVKTSSPEEAAMLFDGVQKVIIIPGYGMAVAQAQHAVKELASLLQENGADVKFAIHPVAGRMPGHMNVLLAEADVDYEILKDLEEIKNEFKNTDIVYVIGANDVVNPAAADDPESPIYGMPILPAHEARTVITVKRSLSAGFAGVKNGLFERENSVMIFDDAKAATEKIIKEIREL